MVRGRQIVSIGRGCEYKGIVQHEILHALGRVHEQSRLDRDNYVTINRQNIKKGIDLCVAVICFTRHFPTRICK